MHNPKSLTFICPFLSRRRLSGFISLYRVNNKLCKLNVVPVNIVQFMYGVNSQDCLGDVKASLILRECVVFYELSHHVSSRHVFHDEVQVVGILKAVIKAYNPWIVFVVVVIVCKHIPFRTYMGYLVMY